MENESESSERKSLVPVEGEPLLNDLLRALRDVNANLGSILHRSDSVVARQNLLIVLCIVAMAFMLGQLGLGLSQQALQKSARAQLLQMEHAREELTQEVARASRDMRLMTEKVGSMQRQLDAAPSVTSDKSGKLSLSLPLTDEVKKTMADTSDLPTAEKLVIPLKPGHSQLTK